MKKLGKTLSLKKETIANLNDQQMFAVKGGTEQLSWSHQCSHDNSCDRVCTGTNCETKHDTFCGGSGCSYMSEATLTFAC
ncbi:MAG: class I lanthipeptide [Cyclobacteriaceae bacterium]|nr:class I lanthipeptide [Cyclobacteriaceae bacterium]